jgi:hypothetical protein
MGPFKHEPAMLSVQAGANATIQCNGKKKSLQQDPRNFSQGIAGSIEAELLKFGALDGPDAHAVTGLILGAFGKLSTNFYSLCTSIEQVAASKLLSF